MLDQYDYGKLGAEAGFVNQDDEEWHRENRPSVEGTSLQFLLVSQSHCVLEGRQKPVLERWLSV